MEAADLVGSFELVSWSRADGVEPFGGGVVGCLHYGDDGTMGAHLMKAGRAPIGFPPRELLKGAECVDEALDHSFSPRCPQGLGSLR